MVFDEWYGNISHAQRAAYRKHNVSQSDHDDLVEHFGEDAHDEITRWVKMNAAANNGIVRIFDLYLGRGMAEPGSLMDTHGIAYNRESYFR